MGKFLVKSVQDKLQYTLYNEINKNDQIMNLVGEPPHIAAERDTLNKVLGVLRKARIVLTKDPDLAPTFNQSNPPPSRPVTSTQSDKETRNTNTYSNPSRRVEEEEPRRKPVEQPSTFTQPPPTNTMPTRNVPPTNPTGGATLLPGKPDNFGPGPTNPPTNVTQPVSTNPFAAPVGSGGNPYGGGGNRPAQPTQNPRPGQNTLFGAPSNEPRKPANNLFG